MPLPFWEVERIKMGQVEGADWKFTSALLITCPRCDVSIILPKSWPRKNGYGTAPCPFCFKTSRIPGRRTR